MGPNCRTAGCSVYHVDTNDDCYHARQLEGVWARYHLLVQLEGAWAVMGDGAAVPLCSSMLSHVTLTI